MHPGFASEGVDNSITMALWKIVADRVKKQIENDFAAIPKLVEKVLTLSFELQPSKHTVKFVLYDLVHWDTSL